MSPLRLLPLFALVLGACAGDVGPAARQAAAALHWTLETQEGRFLGSATALRDDCLLTNHHVVVAADGRPLVARQGHQAWPVTQVRIADGVDAALLGVPRSQSVTPELRIDAPAAGELLAVAGAMAATPLLEVGVALGPAQSLRYGRHLRAARLPVAPGFSGGPVVDERGRLVGIIVAAAAGSMAEAQRLAAGRRAGPLEPRTALLLEPGQALAALGPDAAGICPIGR